MSNQSDLELRVQELEIELQRIKEGIRTNDICMIVDGNDMIDWGWTTILLCNKKQQELRKNLTENL